MPLYLALDFGGTKLAAGVVDGESGRVLGRGRATTDGAGGAAGSIQDMFALGEQALRAAGKQVSDVVGIGISFGGPVQPDRRRVKLSHHVPGWENLPLVDVVSERLGLTTVMDNDANLQALGEWRYGAGRGVDNMLFVNVGTGIGGGVIIAGRLYRGEHGLAGEIGHTVVLPNGPICTCGKPGCLEILAAGPGIARRARAAVSEHPEAGAALRDLAGSDLVDLTAETVFRAAAAGDALATDILTETCTYLGIGISNACAILDSRLVVLDGGVTKAGDVLFKPLRAAAAAYAAPLDPEMIEIVPGKLGDDANILGAVALADQELG